MQFYSTPYENFIPSFRGELIFRVHSLFRTTVLTAEASELNGESSFKSPVVTARMGLQRYEKLLKGIERCERGRN